MYRITNLPTNLLLGHQGEKNVTSYEFDVSSWLEEYPSGLMTVNVRRPGETKLQVYPATGITMSNGVLVWVVDDVDTALAGRGSISLTMSTPEITNVKSTPLIATVIKEGNICTAEVPPGIDQWVVRANSKLDEVTEATDDANRARDDADRATLALDEAEDIRLGNESDRVLAENERIDLYNSWSTAEVTSTTLVPGAPVTANVVIEENKVIFDFGIPQGIQGIVGPQGFSAYQLWINSGNSGTEEDYFAYLKAEALAAADLADEATLNANTAAGLTNAAIAEVERLAPLWGGVTVTLTENLPGVAPTGIITQDETGTHIAIGLRVPVFTITNGYLEVDV